jgi:hypothetical protein
MSNGRYALKVAPDIENIASVRGHFTVALT